MSMSAEEEEMVTKDKIKVAIRRHVGLDPSLCPEDTEWELNNAAARIWEHVIVPMCRT